MRRGEVGGQRRLVLPAFNDPQQAGLEEIYSEGVFETPRLRGLGGVSHFPGGRAKGLDVFGRDADPAFDDDHVTSPLDEGEPAAAAVTLARRRMAAR